MVDIWWYGQACFKVKGKSVAVVFDPFDPDFVGLGKLKLEADIVCVSHGHEDHNNVGAIKADDGREPFVILGPGEYEKSGANIIGVASFHDDSQGQERGTNTVYKLVIDGLTIVHMGDFGQKKLTQEQVEALTGCDVLMIPVGSVYTIAGSDAPQIIAQIEPKVIVPMHYKVPGLKPPLEGVEKFLASMGKEGLSPQPKLSISSDKLPEEPEVVLLQKQ